jgi:hypothetical protein
MSLFNLMVTSIFFLKCSGFACPPGPHRSSTSGPSHLFNGSTPYATSLTGVTSSGQTVKLDFQTSPLTLGQPVNTSGSASLGATDILSFTLSQTRNGSATVELHYGTLFTGVKDVTYNFQNNVITGNMDGRVLNQFGPSSSNTTLTFADGHGAPNVKISPELAASNFNASLQDIQSRILSNESCNTPLARSVPFADTQTLNDLHFRQNNLDYSQDHGHSSNTMGSVGCVVCTTELGLYGAAGTSYCIGVCAALWFTSDCPNCWNVLRPRTPVWSHH